MQHIVCRLRGQRHPCTAVIDGDKNVRIYGKKVPVRAIIHTINSFSAHADQAELLAWHKQTGKSERTFLIHGEEEIMRQFVTHLKGIEIVMPALNEIFNI
ncbi:MAG: MBL fold metallo-hydrolase RNA specificity domain-containing protein [Nitrosomonas sp.]